MGFRDYHQNIEKAALTFSAHCIYLRSPTYYYYYCSTSAEDQKTFFAQIFDHGRIATTRGREKQEPDTIKSYGSIDI
jgi:hypothetical protein